MYIRSINPFKLESEQIEEVNAVDSLTSEETYGYILKETNTLKAKEIKSKRNRIVSGYFFDNNSGCMIYGTMYYGDNGINLFVPSSGATRLLLSDICPPQGSAWAKTKN